MCSLLYSVISLQISPELLSVLPTTSCCCGYCLPVNWLLRHTQTCSTKLCSLILIFCSRADAEVENRHGWRTIESAGHAANAVCAALEVRRAASLTLCCGETLSHQVTPTSTWLPSLVSASIVTQQRSNALVPQLWPRQQVVLQPLLITMKTTLMYSLNLNASSMALQCLRWVWPTSEAYNTCQPTYTNVACKFGIVYVLKLLKVCTHVLTVCSVASQNVFTAVVLNRLNSLCSISAFFSLSPNVWWPSSLCWLQARRGRCHHWRTVHSTEGPCSRCSACGGAPQAVRYSHPMSWSPGMQKEAKRIGLSIRSCVCQPCVEAIRHCAITPAQIASVKDKAANTNGGDADNKTASQTSAARIPYESPPRNSSSSDVSVGSVVSTASSVQTCPLPYCNDVVYCSVGSTTPEMVAKVFKVDVEIVRPPPDELQEVLLCFNHYHHCYRKVKSERNGVATSTTPKAQPNPQSSLSSGIGHVTCRLTTVGNTATPPFTPQQQGMLQASSFPPQQQGMAYATPFPPQQPGTSFCSA